MLNHGVVQLHSFYPYLISMLQKSQIKTFHFIEHHNTCIMILISRNDYKLITQSVFLTLIHHSMFYFYANPILVPLQDCVTDKKTQYAGLMFVFVWKEYHCLQDV